ncbi:MAG: ATPase, partial [Chloroflexi bacterium]|nr:ATPase [Chloroflexota bacterium]
METNTRIDEKTETGPSKMQETKKPRQRGLFDREITGRAIADSFRKLNPVTLARNPVMLVVE